MVENFVRKGEDIGYLFYYVVAPIKFVCKCFQISLQMFSICLQMLSVWLCPKFGHWVRVERHGCFKVICYKFVSRVNELNKDLLTLD